MKFSTIFLEAVLLSVALARPQGSKQSESDLMRGSYAQSSGWTPHSGYRHHTSGSGYPSGMPRASGSPIYNSSGFMMGVHPTAGSVSNSEEWPKLRARDWGNWHNHHPDSISMTITSTSSVTSTSTSTVSATPVLSESSMNSAIESSDSESATTSTQAISSAASQTTTTTIASSSASSVSSSASAASTSSSGKRGLPYNSASLTENFKGSSQVSWAYNWGSSSSGLSGFEYVPMLWGLSSTYTSGWSSAISTALSSGSTHLMSFNEPDLSSQSNISPADAATGYTTYIEPYASKAKLGSPAVTNGGSPMGLTWLKEFIADCSDCTIDFVPIHWYDSATNFAYFKSYVEEAYAAGGNRPLWITEFAGSGTADEQNTFLETVIPWLDSTDMVERYAYFMDASGILVNSDGSLTTLGETWNTYESSTISSEMQ